MVDLFLSDCTLPWSSSLKYYLRLLGWISVRSKFCYTGRPPRCCTTEDPVFIPDFSAARCFCLFMSVSDYHNVCHGQVVFLTVALFWYTWLGGLVFNILLRVLNPALHYSLSFIVFIGLKSNVVYILHSCIH
jgi:hypothetical protein